MSSEAFILALFLLSSNGGTIVSICEAIVGKTLLGEPEILYKSTGKVENDKVTKWIDFHTLDIFHIFDCFLVQFI